MAATELFPFLENLFNKRKFIDSKESFKEQYMAIKFLSLYPGTFSLAAEANRLSSKVPGWAVNALLFHSIKKQRPPRFQYPKGEEKTKTWPKEAVQKIARHLCCSEAHAIQTINIISQQNVNILESLGLSAEGEKKRAAKNKNR